MPLSGSRKAAQQKSISNNQKAKAKQDAQINNSKQSNSDNRGLNDSQTGSQVDRGFVPDTVHQSSQGKAISVELFEKLSVSDQAKVSVHRSVKLREQLALQARSQNTKINQQKIEMDRKKALDESKKTSSTIQSNIEKSKTKIQELEQKTLFWQSEAGQKKLERQNQRTPRSARKRIGYAPQNIIDSRSLESARKELTSLENSLSKSNMEGKKIRNTRSDFNSKRKPTVQKSNHVKVNQIRLYQDDTRSLSEQMKNPASSGPIPFGPYIRPATDSDKSLAKKFGYKPVDDADFINENRQKMQDDTDRSRQITASSVAKFTGLNNIGIVKDIASNIDKSFEFDKLPKERSAKNTPIFGQNFVSLPSNKKFAEQLSPLSNVGGEIADLVRATTKHVKSGGKKGFVKDETFGLPVAEPHYYKIPIDSKEIVAAHVGVIAAGASAGASFGAPLNSPIHPFKNFNSKTINTKPNGKGGGGSSNVIQIGPKYEPKIIKSPNELKITKLDTLPKPEKIIPRIATIPKTSSFKTYQFAEGRSKSGVKFKAIKDLTTGKEVGLMGQDAFVKIEKGIPKLAKPAISGIDEPTEFTKGESFRFGNYEFTETRNNGIRQTTIEDLVTKNKKTVTNVPLGGSDSFKFMTLPKKDSKTFKPSSSLNDAFKGLKITTPEKTEFSFGPNPKTKDGKNVLMQKQKQKQTQTQKQYQKLDLKSLLNQKQHLANKPIFSSKPINLGAGKVSTKSQKFPQSFYSFNKVSSKPIIGIVGVSAGQKQSPIKTKTPKQTPVPFVGVIPEQTPETITDVVPVIPLVPVTPYRVPGVTPEIPPGTPRGGFGFIPYIPKISLSSYGFNQKGAVRSGYSAFGISSDINIKTLPTFSRHGSTKTVLAAQTKEDQKIQNLFYGKKTKRTKSKSGSKSKKKKTNTKKKKRKR